jgi:hypothetical protein
VCLFLHEAQSGHENHVPEQSHGGFLIRIYIMTDQDRLSLAFDLSGGEVGDSRELQTLLDRGHDIE